MSSCLYILMQTHAISIYRNILIRQKGLGKNPKIINIGSILESSVVQVQQLMQILK